MMNLTTMTMVQLTATAKEMGLTKISKLNKAALIEKITIATQENATKIEGDVNMKNTAVVLNNKRDMVKGLLAMGLVILKGFDKVPVAKTVEVIAPVVKAYAVGSYVQNVKTNKFFKVGEEFVVAEKNLVHTFMFIAKGVDLKAVDMTVASLMNPKVYVPVTPKFVMDAINTPVVAAKKFEVNVARTEGGYRSWTVKDNTTQEVFEASEGHSVTNLIRSYRMSHRGRKVNVTISAAETKAPVVPVKETKATAIRKCSCCGKEVSPAQHDFVKKNQDCLPAQLKGKDYCFKCQITTGVTSIIKDSFKAKKAAKLAK